MATTTLTLNVGDTGNQQLLQRLRQNGYTGGYSILKEYVRAVRPPRQPAFLKLHFAPGQCAQVDWGSAGFLPVGGTRRRLSFFVMVLCYSRRMYVEFTLAQDAGTLSGLSPARLRILSFGSDGGDGGQL